MSGARQSIVFYLNGDRCEVAGADSLLMVSEYLRERRGLTGTKIVCSEGDCGSCTVLVGRLTASGFKYLPIDSCIQFVFQLDGAHLVTVDALASGDALTPVQQAMVDCHGSQCGFCTPGFVMAMTGLLEEATGPPEEADWREGLSGNLCRCTGYSQIIEAGQQAAIDNNRLASRFPSEVFQAELEQLRSQPFEVLGRTGEHPALVYSPTALPDALAFRRDHPEARVVAGATDLGVQRNKGRLPDGAYLDVGRIQEMASLAINDANEGRTLIAGATTSWTDLLELCRRELPEFGKILAVFGSPQIRHVGTPRWQRDQRLPNRRFATAATCHERSALFGFDRRGASRRGERLLSRLQAV
ncbi:MAG: 2Fe-2S iron-sulfur cluster-binding protein [Planctomycetota bacterium]